MPIGLLGSTPWPDELAEKAVKLLCEVLACSDSPDRTAAAKAIKSLAHAKSDRATSAVPSLVKAIAKASEERERREILEIADALGEIGLAAAPAVPSLRPLLHDGSQVLQIHAAVALLRVQPGDPEAMHLLLGSLAGDDSAMRWRAADGSRRAGRNAKAAKSALHGLLNDEDVRVRVTAAGALWAIEGDVESVLPVLIRAMKEPDLPLPTRFIYPSNPGDSHRAYVAGIFSEMGPRASAAVPVLVAAIKEGAVDLKQVEPYKAVVGFAAMTALGRIGAGARESLPVIEEVKHVENSVFAAYAHVVSEAIASIENRPK